MPYAPTPHPDMHTKHFFSMNMTLYYLANFCKLLASPEEHRQAQINWHRQRIQNMHMINDPYVIRCQREEAIQQFINVHTKKMRNRGNYCFWSVSAAVSAAAAAVLPTLLNFPRKPLTFFNSTTICKLVDLIAALHQSDCRIPNWVSAKTVLSCSTNHGQTTARFRSFFR